MHMGDGMGGSRGALLTPSHLLHPPHPPRVLMGVRRLPLLWPLLMLPRMELEWRRKAAASTGGGVTAARSAAARASASTGGTVVNARSAVASEIDFERVAGRADGCFCVGYGRGCVLLQNV